MDEQNTPRANADRVVAHMRKGYSERWRPSFGCWISLSSDKCCPVSAALIGAGVPPGTVKDACLKAPDTEHGLAPLVRAHLGIAWELAADIAFTWDANENYPEAGEPPPILDQAEQVVRGILAPETLTVEELADGAWKPVP